MRGAKTGRATGTGEARALARRGAIAFIQRFPRAAVVGLWGVHAVHMAVALGTVVLGLRALPETFFGPVFAVCILLAMVSLGALANAYPQGRRFPTVALSALAVGGVVWLGFPDAGLLAAWVALMAVLVGAGPLSRLSDLLPWMLALRRRHFARLARTFPEQVPSRLFLRQPRGRLRQPRGHLPFRLPGEPVGTCLPYGLTSAAIGALEGQGLQLSPAWRAWAEDLLGVLGCLAVAWLVHAPDRASDEQARLERALADGSTSPPPGRTRL